MKLLETIRDAARRVLCFPLFIGWLVVLLVHALWGQRLWLKNGILFTELHPNSWFKKELYAKWGGTCFGYGIMLSANQPPSTTNHELVHVEQQEVSSLVGLVAGIIAASFSFSAIPFFICWFLAQYAHSGCAMLIALLRGENAYRGNINEESAYAQEEH